MSKENTENRQDSIKKMAKTNRSWLAFTLTVLLVVFLVGLSGYILYSPQDEVYQGQVEISEIRVSGKLPGRIAGFRVKEGQRVHKGDTLVDIYSSVILAKEKQAEAGDQLSLAIQKGLNGRSRTEITNMAMNAWLAAKESLEVGERSFERAERLYKEGVIPAQKYDEVKSKLSALQAAEKITHNQYMLAKRGILSQDKEVAKALVEKSKGVMNEVEAYLNDRYLTSPIDGVISNIFPNVGELVGTGAPIMNIADYNEIKILFPVREDKLHLFPKGEIIKGHIIALNKDVNLQITKYRDLGIYAVDKATKSRGAVDYRNFEVTAIPVDKIDSLVSGMSVIMTVE